MMQIPSVIKFLISKPKVEANFSSSYCVMMRHPVLIWSSFSVGSAVRNFSPFQFSTEPSDTLVVRGAPALLNCSVHGESPAKIEWKKDGSFLSLASDDRRQVLADGSLLISSVVHSKHNKPDEGVYQCVATIDNLGTIVSRTARLNVAGKIRGLILLYAHTYCGIYAPYIDPCWAVVLNWFCLKTNVVINARTVWQRKSLSCLHPSVLLPAVEFNKSVRASADSASVL